MTPPDIREIVPHSGRMLLLDRLVSCDADTLTAEVTIRPDSMFVQDGAVGAWVGLEYMAQAIAAFAGHQAREEGEKPKIGFLLGSRQYACSTPCFRIGTTLRVAVTRELQGDSGLGSFTCQIRAEGIVADATLTVFQPNDAEQFMRESPE